MKYYIGIFVFVLLYKVILNTINYFQTVRFQKGYFLWLSEQNDGFTTYRSKIINLFKNADIEDLYLPTTQPLGFGQIVNFKASVFKNFPSKIQDHVITTMRFFDDAIGIYRGRIFESFNPLYWINLIIFFPKNIFCYLGVKPENILIKISQLIWWFIGIVSAIFKEELVVLIKSLVNSKVF